MSTNGFFMYVKLYFKKNKQEQKKETDPHCIQEKLNVNS